MLPQPDASSETVAGPGLDERGCRSGMGFGFGGLAAGGGGGGFGGPGGGVVNQPNGKNSSTRPDST